MVQWSKLIKYIMQNSGNDNPNLPKRDEIRLGDAVQIITKENYGTGNYTQGVVRDILSPGNFHPRGIKVRLTDGTIGRVQWKME